MYCWTTFPISSMVVIMRKDACGDVAAVDVLQLLLLPCMKLTISCQTLVLCCQPFPAKPGMEDRVGGQPVLSTICLLHQQPNCQPISNCTILISRVGWKGLEKQCWTERLRCSYPTAGGKIFQGTNGAIQGKTGVVGKKICHSIHRHLADRNLRFKINAVQEGLLPSLNPGAALRMLAATKITGKNIQGRKSSLRCKVETFV